MTAPPPRPPPTHLRVQACPMTAPPSRTCMFRPTPCPPPPPPHLGVVLVQLLPCRLHASQQVVALRQFGFQLRDPGLTTLQLRLRVGGGGGGRGGGGGSVVP